LAKTDTDLGKAQSEAPIEIHGTEGLIVNYGGCCFPIPGDEIVGITSAEKGMVVHTDRCPNSLRYSNTPERYLPLVWGAAIDREFPLELRLEITKNRGIVARLATLVSSEEASIMKISQEEEDADITVVHMVIGVTSRVHLARIFSKLHRLPGVNKVRREKH
jgi:(p)ppGpp synthase/HD superfamily hydrolase